MVKIWGWQNKSSIPRGATFTLTEIGSRKAETFSGDDRTRVLMALEQNGASTTEEMSRIAKVNKGKVERMIPTLIRGGFIQSVRGDIND